MDPEPSPSSAATVRGLLAYVARGNALRTAIIIALSIVSSALMLGQPLLVQQLLNRIVEPPSVTIPIAVSLLLLVSLAAAGTAVNRYLIAAQSERVAARLRRDLLRTTLWMSIERFAQQKIGDLMSRIVSDTTLVKTAIASGLFNIFGQVGLLVGAVVGMATIDLVLLGVVLGAMGIVVLISAVASRQIRSLSAIAQERLGSLSSSLKSAFGALRTIRASNSTAQEHARLVRSVVEAQNTGLALARRSSIIQPMMNVFAQVAIVLVICVGAVRISMGLISAQDLVAFALFLMLTVTPLGDLATVIVNVQSATGALRRILEVLGWPTEDQQSIDSPRFGDYPKSVRVRHLSFRYPGAQNNALSDVDMAFPAGMTTAIVGPSGAGKSTLFNLLLRFYDPTSGDLEIGGRSIDDLSRSEVRANISYVPQDGGIVDGSLRDNLRIGNPELDDATAIALMIQLGLDELNGFADHGLDLEVGDQGTYLSGGERQRVALVRALLRDSPVILLDEPTSSLDGENEVRFSDILAGLSGNRTIVVIAHRLQTIHTADRIYVLDHGSVEAVGSHAQLMTQSSVYPRLMSTGEQRLS